MHRLPKKAIANTKSDYHRNCHLAYVPRAIKMAKPQAPTNIRYEHYIDLAKDSEPITSYEKEPNIPTENPNSNKSEPKKEDSNDDFVEEEIIDNQILGCHIDKGYYNNPLFVNHETVKTATPIKKINFNLPSEKSISTDDLEEDDQPPPPDERMDWNDYHRLSVIDKFLDDLEADFPSLCTTVVIGKSVEGRNLKILKISNSNASNACVWVDAGIHAREWIAPAVNTYLADHICRNFDTLPESIRNKDWYFLPVVNPDGYEYSHKKDRMWRKNRARYGGQYVGVDLNRNFSIGWGGRGSSDQPNNVFYRGPHPFSEPESSAIRDVFLKSGVRFKVYLTLHSYGQIIIFPYACSSELAPDYVRLLEGATAMSKAIYNANGNTYKVGISRDVMYGAAGTSNDFAYGAAGIPYCYLIELRSKQHKFKLPKEDIEDTCIEILSCVKALMEFVDTYKYNKRTDPNQVIEVGMKKNVSFLEPSLEVCRSNSRAYVQRDNSYIGKQDSYDKRSYSFVNDSDTEVKNGNSFVRWINVPSNKDESVDNKQNDSYANKHEYKRLFHSDIERDSYETINNSFIGQTNEGSFLSAKDSFISKEDCLDTDEAFLKKTDSYMKKADYYMKKTDSYMRKTNSCMNRTESYMKKSESYMNKTKPIAKTIIPYEKDPD